MGEKRRVVAFIDGFNLYHAIERNPNLKKYKWCDLRKLVEQFIDPTLQEITGVFYFTAYCFWDSGKEERHKKYVEFLKHARVNSILGHYSRVEKVFNTKMKIFYLYPPFWRFFRWLLPRKICYQNFEEKQTDVNIAVKILEYAFKNSYDDALIVSGDSDLVPAIKTAKRHFPDKKFISILPPKSKGKTIQRICHESKQIVATHLENSLLPEKITVDGKDIFKPAQYS